MTSSVRKTQLFMFFVIVNKIMDITDNCSDFSSSDDEIVVTSQGGIRPYRFEPIAVNIQADGEESSSDESAEEDTPFTHPIDFGSRLGQPVDRWCTCDRCLAMDNPLMNLCCHELDELQGKLFAEDLDCICLHSEFQGLVLWRPALRTALVAMKDVKKTTLVEPITERYVILWVAIQGPSSGQMK